MKNDHAELHKGLEEMWKHLLYKREKNKQNQEDFEKRVKLLKEGNLNPAN